jgi:hypothetical protein
MGPDEREKRGENLKIKGGNNGGQSFHINRC